MKFCRRMDIFLLLGVLLVFCCGISLLHASQQVPSTNGSLQDKDKDMFAHLSPLMAARDVKKIGDSLAAAPLGQQKRLAEAIINSDKTALQDNDKVELILILASKSADSDQQNSILNLLHENPQLVKKVPVFYSAVLEKNDAVIPVIMKWLSDKPTKLKEWAYDALYMAIIKNQPQVAGKLLQNLNNLSQKELTNLLWETVSGKKDQAFIKSLVAAGADSNDARKGKTLLITAVELNQPQLVQALIDNGAQSNAIADPAVGSALQVAVRKGFADIDQLLRKNGARE